MGMFPGPLCLLHISAHVREHVCAGNMAVLSLAPLAPCADNTGVHHELAINIRHTLLHSLFDNNILCTRSMETGRR